MSPADHFVARPVATSLLTLAVAFAGLGAWFLLPVAPLPQVDFPTIAVQAQLPGADPATMAATVAAPLERTLGRIAGVTEMTSTSNLGNTSIILQFDLDRDIDGAARDVQAAINAARSLLPTGLPSNPSYRKINPADSPIMILAATSEVLAQGQIYDAASTVLAQRLAQIDGIGQVSLGGSALPAVRVRAQPGLLSRFGIGIEGLRKAIAAANVETPKGAIEDGDRRWQLAANDQIRRAADYLPLVVAYHEGAPVRLRDVATAEDSVQDIHNAGFVDGKPAVLIILSRQPGANIIATVDRVRALLPHLRQTLPAAITLDVVMDRTPTIRASLGEVEQALGISTALVVMVVFLFLRSGRAAAIPSIAIPVSLAGTLAVMYLAGFSLNMVSLMALTVATGFVVDDAVVVIENVARGLQRGLTPFEAACRGAREVGFTVIAMSLSLVAVFVPILFMGGLVGRMFREFSVTLATAVLISLVVSLTTTPMLCAQWLRPEDEAHAGRFGRLGARAFERIAAGYRHSLERALAHPGLVLAALLLTVACNVWMYVTIPKGFFPQQDTGRLMGAIQGDQGASFQAARGKLETHMRLVAEDPAVETVVGWLGGQRGGAGGGGQLFVVLKSLEGRRASATAVMARLRGRLAHVPGATLYLQPVQDIRAGGRSGNAQYQYTLRAESAEALRQWSGRILAAMKRLPSLVDVNIDQQDRGRETRLVVDRDRRARLGLTQRQIDDVLNDLFGQRLISTIYGPMNQYRVVLEAAPEFLQGPEALAGVYLTAANGEPVPLGAFAHTETAPAPLSVNHQGQFPATTITFNLPPRVSLSTAAQDIDAAIAKLAPPATVQAGFQGTARVFQEAVANQVLLIVAALVAVYIVLGILYESYVHPFTILTTLPSAGVGALLALEICGLDFSLIALIGVILLIGIVKKNAIMMVDFAEQARRGGLPAPAAIREACVLRLRPILMTTLAALFGALPLALGRGDGAELRVPLGVSIVGGLLLSQVLTLYTTPVVYLELERLAESFGRRRRTRRTTA